MSNYSTTIGIIVNGVDHVLTVEAHITDGTPGRLYGEPGDCYPEEPGECEIESLTDEDDEQVTDEQLIKWGTTIEAIAEEVHQEATTV